MTKEYLVPIVDNPLQEGVPIAIINQRYLLSSLNFIQKIKLYILGHIEISEIKRRQIAKTIFQDSIFGYEADYGDKLYWLTYAHCHELWELNSLNDSDIEKIKALEAFTIATRNRFNDIKSHPKLNLELGTYEEDICHLLIPISRKIPVYSIRYFLDIHIKYAFNKIRESAHDSSNDIISLFYELLFLQQKIALSLLSFIETSSYVGTNKNDTMFLAAELDSIIRADSIFIYLKASIEKNVALLGYILGIKGLENKKTQKSRVSELSKKLNEIKDAYYIEPLLELISSEAIEDINKFRTGILHKKGMSDLQPHNYVGVSPNNLPYLRLFEIMYKQHQKGTLCLIITLAILTDSLVILQPKDQIDFLKKFEIFKRHLNN